jgi:hypothetical protein
MYKVSFKYPTLFRAVFDKQAAAFVTACLLNKLIQQQINHNQKK